MANDERDPETARRLEEDDPIHRAEADVDEEEVEQAWEETEAESGDAPTG